MKRWMIEVSSQKDVRQIRFLLDGIEVKTDDFAQWIRDLTAEKDNALLQNGELKNALLDASRLLTLFALNDLTMEDVRAFLPVAEALCVEKPITEKRKEEPPIENTQPIGYCKACGFPVYTEVGYCGGCVRS